MTGPTKAQLMQELERVSQAYDRDVVMMRERLAELELALEDVGWTPLMVESQNEFSRDALKKINKIVRIFWLKNPLIKRAVYTQTCYVFGQGISIRAEHPLVNDVVQPFVRDAKNRAELFEHQSLMLKETELQLFANIFFVFFINRRTGAVRLRTIPPDEVQTIVCNPEDSKDPWYYLRTWTETRIDPATGSPTVATKSVYYPDWRHTPAGGHPATIGSIRVAADTPVYHVAVNCLSDMHFGVSEVYAACDWAAAYKSFLEDWSTIVRAYSRFAMAITTKGGAKGVAAAKSKLASSLSLTSSETNPAPVSGSTFIGTEGVTLSPVRTAGATTSMDDARRLMLMVCSGTGIFEHYLTGDPSTGNLATAKAMERPMELMFRDRQELWRSVIHEILQFVVDCAAVAPGSKLGGTVGNDGYGDSVVVLANDKDNDDPEKRTAPIDRTIQVAFPPMLEHDITAQMGAIVDAATMRGLPQAGTLPLKTVTRLILQAFGEENIDETLSKLFPDGTGEDLAAAAPQQSPGNEPDDDIYRLAMAAVENLYEALRDAGVIA